MRNRIVPFRRAPRVALVAALVGVLWWPGCSAAERNGAGREGSRAEESGGRTVRGRLQPAPGVPPREIEVGVRESPVNLPVVPASKAHLGAGDLVLGVLLDGEAIAFPIRYLARYEIVDHRVGKTPVAPTW